MEKAARWDTVHGITKNHTGLNHIGLSNKAYADKQT